MSVAVEYFFTVSALLENTNYANATHYGLILQSRLFEEYTSPTIGGSYVNLCVAYNAEYFTSDTEVFFAAPRFSQIQIEVVHSHSPTAVPAKESSRKVNAFTSSVPYLYLYVIAAGIFFCIFLCVALIIRNWYKSKRKLPIRNTQVSRTTNNQDFDFDEIDFYSPTPNQSTETADSKLQPQPYNLNSKYRGETSSFEEKVIELKKIETEEPTDNQESTANEAPKSKMARITIISSGSTVGGSSKKKLNPSKSESVESIH